MVGGPGAGLTQFLKRIAQPFLSLFEREEADRPDRLCGFEPGDQVCHAQLLVATDPAWRHGETFRASHAGPFPVFDRKDAWGTRRLLWIRIGCRGGKEQQWNAAGCGSLALAPMDPYLQAARIFRSEPSGPFGAGFFRGPDALDALRCDQGGPGVGLDTFQTARSTLGAIFSLFGAQQDLVDANDFLDPGTFCRVEMPAGIRVDRKHREPECGSGDQK